MRIFINCKRLMSALTGFHWCQLRSNLCMDCKETQPVREKYMESYNKAQNSVSISHEHFKFSLVVLELLNDVHRVLCACVCRYIYTLNTNVLSTFCSQFLTFICLQLVNKVIWYSSCKQHWWLMFSGWTYRVRGLFPFPHLTYAVTGLQVSTRVSFQ